MNLKVFFELAQVQYKWPDPSDLMLCHVLILTHAIAYHDSCIFSLFIGDELQHSMIRVRQASDSDSTKEYTTRR